MISAICLMNLILLGQLNLLRQLQYFITLKIKRFFSCHLALFSVLGIEPKTCTS